MIELLKQINGLFEFQLKTATRHDLDEIRITVPRARMISKDIRETIKEAKKQTERA
jgi:hypothetical protein